MNKILKEGGSWREAVLGDLVFFQRGFDITKADQKQGNIPVVSSSGVSSYHSESRAHGPGVVIGRKGSLGTIHYVDGQYWPHDTTLWSKDLKGNHPGFVYYFLHTLGLERYDVGNSNPTLNRNHIHKLPIQIPEYYIQERIASILSAYDDLNEYNRRRIQLLEQTGRLLYKEWFVHLRFPGNENVKVKDGLPVEWKLRKIADVCETVGGGTPSTKVSDYWDGDVTWVVPTDVTKNDCLVLHDSARKITEKGLRESSAQLVPAKTILMTSRASVGFFALMDVEACTNQGFINIIPHDEKMRMYLLFNLMSRVEEIRSNARGTTYPEINKGRFGQMEIVIPDKDLLVQFSNIVSQVVKQVGLLRRLSLQVMKGRGLLLPKLMSRTITE